MDQMRLPQYQRRERAVRSQVDGENLEDRGLFHADDFVIPLPEGWVNETVYVLTGPVEDGMRHTIRVNVDPSAGDVTLLHYADTKIEETKTARPGCRLLAKRWTQLENGQRAYRAVLVWAPTEDRRLYQHQFYVVCDGVGYQLSAAFTRKTRRTMGPRVEKALRAFTPHAPLRMRRDLA